VELISGSLKLRSFDAEDTPILVALCNNKKIWDNVRDYFPHPYTQKNAKEFIGLATSKIPQEIFAIEFDGKLAGCISVHPQNDVYRLSAEIGYWIGEPIGG
jgi:RimJ/RimL family protein N-acetyltransferase